MPCAAFAVSGYRFPAFADYHLSERRVSKRILRVTRRRAAFLPAGAGCWIRTSKANCRVAARSHTRGYNRSPSIRRKKQTTRPAVCQRGRKGGSDGSLKKAVRMLQHPDGPAVEKCTPAQFHRPYSITEKGFWLCGNIHYTHFTPLVEKKVPTFKFLPFLRLKI